jgi:hypothetical protein
VASRASKRRARLRAADHQIGPDEATIVHTFDDDWTIRKPTTLTDIWRLGELMHNCLRRKSWQEDLDRDDNVAHLIHSLHDDDGYPRAIFAHLPPGTIYNDDDTGTPITLGQTAGVRAYGESKPKAEYLTRLKFWHLTLPYVAEIVHWEFFDPPALAPYEIWTHRNEILQAAEDCGAQTIHAYNSTTPGGDVDLLVRMKPGTDDVDREVLAFRVARVLNREVHLHHEAASLRFPGGEPVDI